MGIGGISVWQLLIIMVIVMLLFGTKRIAQLGDDVGAAIKGFRRGVKDTLPEAAGAARDLNKFRDEVAGDIKQATKLAAGLTEENER